MLDRPGPGLNRVLVGEAGRLAGRPGLSSRLVRGDVSGPDAAAGEGARTIVVSGARRPPRIRHPPPQARQRPAAGTRAVLCELVPSGVPEQITATQAARIRHAAKPSGIAGPARGELART